MAETLQCHVAKELLRLKAPFRISGYTFETWPVVTVTLRRHNLIGRGEASGVYYLNDTVEKIVGQLEELRDRLPFSLTRADVRQMLPPGGARNALDCALWDLESRELRTPVWQLAGVREPKALVTVYTLSADPPDGVARNAKALQSPKAIKLKLTGDTADDIKRIENVRHTHSDTWLGVDANQGFTRDTLKPLIPVLSACKVSLLEQPFPRGRESDMDGLALPVPTAADESCQDLSEMEALVGRFDLVNIKLDKCGGLTEALMMHRRARELGLGVMVGNMMGTSLSAGPGFVLGQLCDVVDLDNALGLAADRDPPIRYADGEVWVPPEAWGAGKA
jgi:L-alanine-DL-glutamate epimerase-like enolase superfamily enzyme